MSFSAHYDLVAKAIHFLSENRERQPSLEEAAAHVQLSPFHFQRVFKEYAGVSPKRFLQYLSAQHLKGILANTGSLSQAAADAGLSAQSRVYDLFVSIEAVSPGSYRQQGAHLKIWYGYHFTPFGRCFIAVTGKGICALAFVEVHTQQEEWERFAQKWAAAELIQDEHRTQAYIDRIFEQPNTDSRLLLQLQGTNFQLKVWEALLHIPEGAVSTYQQIAEQIGHPKAVRAVGSAVGDNPVAYLIPCHRVIRKEGKLGEYHWGPERKKVILGWEAARHYPEHSTTELF